MAVLPDSLNDGDKLPADDVNQIVNQLLGGRLPVSSVNREYLTDTYDLGSNITKWRSLYLSDNISAGGSCTLGSDITIGGSCSIAGKIEITGSCTISENLFVTQNVVFDGNLDVPYVSKCNFIDFLSAGQIRGDSSNLIYLESTTDKFATGGESNPDCSNGGICIQENTNFGKILSLKSTSIAHGVTSLAENDTYGYFQKVSSSNGGLISVAITESTLAYHLLGICTTESSTISCINIDGGIKSGTGYTALADSSKLIGFANSGIDKAYIMGDGSMFVEDTKQVACGGGAISTSTISSTVNTVTLEIDGVERKIVFI